jgi:hypothetical protein
MKSAKERWPPHLCEPEEFGKTSAGYQTASIGGFTLLFFVMKENSYASRVVEIQEDQKLIDTGFRLSI